MGLGHTQRWQTRSRRRIAVRGRGRTSRAGHAELGTGTGSGVWALAHGGFVQQEAHGRDRQSILHELPEGFQLVAEAEALSQVLLLVVCVAIDFIGFPSPCSCGGLFCDACSTQRLTLLRLGDYDFEYDDDCCSGYYDIQLSHCRNHHKRSHARHDCLQATHAPCAFATTATHPLRLEFRLVAVLLARAKAQCFSSPAPLQIKFNSTRRLQAPQLMVRQYLQPLIYAPSRVPYRDHYQALSALAPPPAPVAARCFPEEKTFRAAALMVLILTVFSAQHHRRLWLCLRISAGKPRISLLPCSR